MSDYFTYPIANDRELEQRYITLLMCEKAFKSVIDNSDNISIELQNTRKDLIVDIKHSISYTIKLELMYKGVIRYERI